MQRQQMRAKPRPRRAIETADRQNLGFVLDLPRHDEAD